MVADKKLGRKELERMRAAARRAAGRKAMIAWMLYTSLVGVLIAVAATAVDRMARLAQACDAMGLAGSDRCVHRPRASGAIPECCDGACRADAHRGNTRGRDSRCAVAHTCARERVRYASACSPTRGRGHRNDQSATAYIGALFALAAWLVSTASSRCCSSSCRRGSRERAAVGRSPTCTALACECRRALGRSSSEWCGRKS